MLSYTQIYNVLLLKKYTYNFVPYEIQRICGTPTIQTNSELESILFTSLFYP